MPKITKITINGKAIKGYNDSNCDWVIYSGAHAAERFPQNKWTLTKAIAYYAETITTSTVENNPHMIGGYLAFNRYHDLIGVISTLREGDKNYPSQKYRIAWIGGDIHGKIYYASDFENLENQVDKVAMSFFNNIETIAS